MIYTESQLLFLAHNSPEELAKLLINPRAETKLLISGIEVFTNEVIDEQMILSVIRALIKHMNALVREGAMIGVTNFYTTNKPPPDIIDIIKNISINDPSPMLRSYAKDLLEDI